MISFAKELQFFLKSIGGKDYERRVAQVPPSFLPMILYFEEDELLRNQESLQMTFRLLIKSCMNPVAILGKEYSTEIHSMIEENGKNESLFCAIRLNPELILSSTFIKKKINEALEKKLCPLFFLENLPLKKAVENFLFLGHHFYLLRERGAILDLEGRLIPYIYADGISKCYSHQEREILGFCQEIVFSAEKLTIFITSFHDLIREIFTLQRQASIFRKKSNILYFSKIEDTNTSLLKDLLRGSFQSSLRDDSILKKVSDFYIQEKYHAAALLEVHPFGFYLSKFAVRKEKRGFGLAEDLWLRIEERHKKIFWRCSELNPMKNRYFRLADGFQRVESWLVFWKGLEARYILQAVDFCTKRPNDFQSQNHLFSSEESI